MELGDEIQRRHGLDNWLQRRNFAELTINIYSMIAGKQDIKITDLIGEPPIEIPEGAAAAAASAGSPERTEGQKIKEWKEIARARGLKGGA